MLITNHFPEEIRKEIELDKIKVTEKSSMGNITLTGRDPQRAAKIKVKRAKKVEGTYGEIDLKTFRHLWNDLFIRPAVGVKMWNFMRNHENGFSLNGSQWTWQSW